MKLRIKLVNQIKWKQIAFLQERKNDWNLYSAQRKFRRIRRRFHRRFVGRRRSESSVNVPDRFCCPIGRAPGADPCWQEFPLPMIWPWAMNQNSSHRRQWKLRPHCGSTLGPETNADHYGICLFNKMIFVLKESKFLQ